MRSLPLALAAGVAALLLVGASPASLTPANADGDDLQEQIDEILLTHPGGTQVGANVITWDDGAITLTLAAPDAMAARSVGSCPTGAYCAYNAVNLTGSRISFTTCGTTVSTSALPGSVRSIANARASGTVQGLNSFGTPLTTIGAGGQSNSTPAGIVQLRCVI